MSAPSIGKPVATSGTTERSGFTLYAVTVVLCLLAALVYKQRADGVFACGAQGYATTTFLADCAAAGYGDYDHGAFWFGLEPEATKAAAAADVLFLGNSRMQFALSTAATRDWFSAAGLRHYLLGFSHSETVVFTGPLLERMQPRPRVVVINVDRFFDDRVSPPMQQLKSQPNMEQLYRERRGWQPLHRGLCGVVPALCGSAAVVYRDRTNGGWRIDGTLPGEPAVVSDAPASGTDRWPAYFALGERFLAELGVPRQCVVLTLVPTVATKRAEAEAIAAAMKLNLVAPAIDGLTTFDGSHLDAASAARWSAAFLAAAGPSLRACAAGRPAGS